MNPIRHFAAALLAACASLPAAAVTYSTDYSDLWWLPVEDGWGVNVQQQGEVVFATLFVYGADNSPRWFVAPNTTAVGAPSGQNAFSGPLFTVTGTYYGAPWAGRTPTQVGTVTFNFTSPTNGTITYTANGVQVTKAIVRQTWRNNVLTGTYIGGLTALGTGCSSGQNTAVLVNGEMSINHANPSNPTFQVQFFNSVGQAGTCTYTGSYAQDGRFGRLTGGTFSCTIQGQTNPPVGTFTLTQIDANTNGLTARFQGSDQFCTSYNGFFGGTRDVF